MKNSFTRYFPMIARILLGLVFALAGVAGFMQVSPKPGSMPPGALDLLAAFKQSGYMSLLIAVSEFVPGVLLLVNRFVPLALALLAPTLVNILLFHIFLAPSGIAPGVVVTILELYLAWSYRKVYAPMLVARTKPGEAS